MDVREIIRDELQRREWSQRELCRRADMLPHQLCEYLNGNRDIYVDTLQRILEALELEIRPLRYRRRARSRRHA
jgi:transcriptional regulator with XRE-family HTH domain